MENILLEALKTSSIDFNIDSDEKYQYELIANGEEKIVTRLRKYFEDCDEFVISVAFITMGGISLFLEELKNLENKGIKGKIKVRTKIGIRYRSCTHYFYYSNVGYDFYSIEQWR